MNYYYIHQLPTDAGKDPIEKCNELAKQYGYKVKVFPDSDGIANNIITGFIKLTRLGKDNPYVYLSGMPGNCSMLVLSGIQKFFGDPFNSRKVRTVFIDAVKTSLSLCRYMGYARLLITGTSTPMMEFLVEEMNFQPLETGIVNLHSAMDNYLLSRNTKTPVRAFGEKWKIIP